jgi:RNA polymerase sigma factor (sigma-70 family)
MPNESMTSSLSPDEKAKLDEFITRNYPKLRKYAMYRCRSNINLVDDLLSESIIRCYQGYVRFNMERGPLAFFQRVLKTTWRDITMSRQSAFERGVRITQENGKFKSEFVLDYPVVENEVVYLDEIEQRVYQRERYQLFNKLKSELSPQEQELIQYLEQGYSIENAHKELSKTYSLSFRTCKAIKSHLFGKIRALMATHLQDES